MQETLASKSQFYTAVATLETLFSECYFKNKDGKFQWPEAFHEFADECKILTLGILVDKFSIVGADSSVHKVFWVFCLEFLYVIQI